MFILVRPQVARHSSGFVVKIASRDRVLLEEMDGSVVEAEAELGAVACVFKGTMKRRGADGAALPMSEGDRTVAAQRMADGLRAMGGPAEVS